jgi:transglutaminase-like putative cysteine protease
MSVVRYRVEHETHYRHAEAVTVSKHVACLTPRTLPRQLVQAFELAVTPEPADRATRVDYFGNLITHFTILRAYHDLHVVARSVVDVRAPTPIDAASSPPWEAVAAAAAAIDDEQFRFASPFAQTGDDLAAYARQSLTARRPLLEAALDLTHRIHHDFRFDAGATAITTPVSRVLVERRGVCQDFAHLQIACLRSLGLVARYVSGYLLTDPPPGLPRLVGADASHAWLSVWCPVNGWVDMDPTNDLVPADRHIVIGWGRDYGDVSPLRGVVLGGGEHSLTVGVSVSPMAGSETQTPI